MQQNLNLKSFINNLQQQLTMQRSKFEINKRKNERYTKQFNRQFQKQIYYSGKNPNSYLVSGVKYQYEHIKSCNYLWSQYITINAHNLKQYSETETPPMGKNSKLMSKPWKLKIDICQNSSQSSKTSNSHSTISMPRISKQSRTREATTSLSTGSSTLKTQRTNPRRATNTWKC